MTVWIEQHPVMAGLAINAIMVVFMLYIKNSMAIALNAIVEPLQKTMSMMQQSLALLNQITETHSKLLEDRRVHQEKLFDLSNDQDKRIARIEGKLACEI